MGNQLIGIGLTTRNRPHVLSTALQHFAGTLPPGSRFVIVDDCSDNPDDAVRLVSELQATRTDCEIFLRSSPVRLGISKAKNACLAALMECDHVFLFDDDCWPISPTWAQQWIEINAINGIQHSMFNVGMENLLDRNPAFKAVVKAKRIIGSGSFVMVSYTNCFGVMLYFTRECLNAVGGYDTNTPNLYGYEHAQISNRIASLHRFTQNEHYWTPWIATDLIYSVDISYCMLKMNPPIHAEWLGSFTSSVSANEMASAEQNSIIMQREQAFIPLVDPFSELL